MQLLPEVERKSYQEWKAILARGGKYFLVDGWKVAIFKDGK